MKSDAIRDRLLPSPQEISTLQGALELPALGRALRLPAGPANVACGRAVRDALRMASVVPAAASSTRLCEFALGEAPALPDLPTGTEAYVLAVGEAGIAARAGGPAGLLYAAETLKQLVRLFAAEGRIPAMAIRDWPNSPMRGIYIEGGQERHGRIVDTEYLKAQIRRLASQKMNTLVVEAYNLFPYASFPGCADDGTLTRGQCREIIEEARRYHVTLVPSLQTLAQAYELVWANPAGEPYREATAPGLICPSNPEVYPFIKGLYRDLLTWFDQSPMIGIGCSEIDMQWQSRYCPRCKARIDRGETVRDLLLDHAERCIQAVHELSAEMGRPVRPLMWGDEFYMYGPGHDWVGLDRIPRDVIMGYWKYWPDYQGIAGLMDRGYDVFGVSAIYNHCFYLADLSPAEPRKSWPTMEDTGLTNIAGLAEAGSSAAALHTGQRFLGVATASFSKHRLRAFDTLWTGFALNAQCLWSGQGATCDDTLATFLPAYVQHTYDCRTGGSVDRLTGLLKELDALKSTQELANQKLNDVVGVVDTQEANYLGNTVLGAYRKCRGMVEPTGLLSHDLAVIREAAERTALRADQIREELQGAYGRGQVRELALAAAKIANHARRQALLIDSAAAVARASSQTPSRARQAMRGLGARWSRQVTEVKALLRSSAGLATQGDPTGFGLVLADSRLLMDHFVGLGRGVAAPAVPTATAPILAEPLVAAPTAGWEVIGNPTISSGTMQTEAPGGWGRLCGLLSKEAFQLDEARPLVVTFAITPRKFGVDSQLVASAENTSDINFRFAMACNGGRFSVHTQSAARLPDGWVDPSPGWKQRSASPTVELGHTYHVVMQVTSSTFRVRFTDGPGSQWDLPFWDTGVVPMDRLGTARLLFADVEPEGSHGATTWGPITVSR